MYVFSLILLPLSSSLSVLSPLHRAAASIRSDPRTPEDLKLGIGGFYDRSSKLWEDVWGEHMHHGYYDPPDRQDHREAQVDMIDRLLEFAGVESADTAVDVGCGIGGSSRHIARKFGAKVEGITLSTYQAGRGNELAEEQGLGDRCGFRVADALDQPFNDGQFDLVWSLESGEHMPDKKKFVEELVRVAKPGGTVIVCTWCHRDLDDGEELGRKEKKVLKKVNRAYYLPEWCSVKDYVGLVEGTGEAEPGTVRTADWSHVIAPFWKAVIRSAATPRSLVGILRSGFSTVRGAWAMLLMLRGYQLGTIKFGVITFKKKME